MSSVRPKRSYSDQQRADTLLALQSNNGNLSETVRQTGVPLATIALWRDNPREAITDLCEQKKQPLSAFFQDVAYKALGVIDVKLSKPNAHKLPLAGLNAVAGTATEKYLLLTGQPTSIAASVERQELVVILQAALAEMRAEEQKERE